MTNGSPTSKLWETHARSLHLSSNSASALAPGHAVLKRLLGVEDVRVGGRDMSGIDLGNARFAVEDEIVAEVMDAYAYEIGPSSSNDIEEWEEFQPAGQGKFVFFNLITYLSHSFSRYFFFGINTCLPVTTCPYTYT
jgi:hypothetical protein